MSAAFDGSGYRQRVLAVLRTRAPLRLDDPFFVADLDPEVAHPDDEVQARLARVLAFLQRERNSAKYAAIAAELVRRRAEWEAPLLDPAARETLRLRVLDARRDGEAERLTKVDGYLATLRERFGGVPASRVDGLRRLAAQAGVTGEQFEARLARERIIEDGIGVAPLPAEVREQIRDRLDELRTLRRGDHASTASLWAFLSLAPTATPQQLVQAYEAVAAVNARRPHDREKTVTSDLLALTRARLIEGDPAAYTAGLLADVADELRSVVEEHVLLDGEITAVAFEGLMRRALGSGRGLTPAQVRTVVLGLARDLGAPVSTGTTVDFVSCPSCGRPEPVGEVRHCRYCGTDLYTVCPACARYTEAAAVACRHCGHSVRQSRDAADAVTAIRRALDEGRPAEAFDLVNRARPVLALAGAQAIAAGEELAARASAMLAAADSGWRALFEDRAAGRAQAALDRARWLVAQAADVPGPDGRGAAEVLEELTLAQAMVRRRIEAALALPPAAREAALVAVLQIAPDNPEALAALAVLPLPAPEELLAIPGPLTAAAPTGAVMLRWRPAETAAPVTYLVERVVAGTLGAPPSRTSLGTTTVPEFADAGAPAWAPVFYEVTALSGTRRSQVTRTAPLVLTREVDQPRAVQTKDGVQLTWRLEGPVQLVTIERAVEDVDPGAAMAALERDEGPDLPRSGMPLPGLAPEIDRSVRHTRVGGGQLVDPDVQPGVTYRYRLSVEYVAADGTPARTPGVEVSVAVQGRLRPVLDLAVAFANGETALGWTAPAGVDVHVYATPGVLPDPPVPPGRFAAPAGLIGPFGPEHTEVLVEAVSASARLVGVSRRGRLLDPAATGPVIYTPVSTSGGRGVVGRPVQHVAPGGVTELRAEDRGDELVLFFRLAPGLTEARVLWRRDRMPTGPDDPAASAATVTTAGLELRGGGWRLAAPRDGWPYYVACFPVFRAGGQPRAAAAGAELVARTAARPAPADAATGPLPAPGGGTSYLAPVPPGPPPAAAPVMQPGPQPAPAMTGMTPLAPMTGALPVGPATASTPLPAPLGAAGPRPPVPAAASGPLGVPGAVLPPRNRPAAPGPVPGQPRPAFPAGPQVAVPAGSMPGPLPPRAGLTTPQPAPPVDGPPPAPAALPRQGGPAHERADEPHRPAATTAPPTLVAPAPASAVPTAPVSENGSSAVPAARPESATATAPPSAPAAAEDPPAEEEEPHVSGWLKPRIPVTAPRRAWATLPATHTDLYAPLGAGAGWTPYDDRSSAAPAPAAGPPEADGARDLAADHDGDGDGDERDDDRDLDSDDRDDLDLDDDYDDYDDYDDDEDDEDLDDDLDDGAGRDGEPWASYSVTRSGWRRRTLRVRVRSDGDVPELVLVARPGTRPPSAVTEGQALARLAPTARRGTRTMEVRLDGALLPWGVRLLPATGADDDLAVDHPPDDTLVVR